MSLSRRGFLHCIAGFAVPALVREANAQAYPSRPITLVVPFGAGGPSDTIGRILADGMRTRIGQPVIIENIPGASGTIGVGRVARAAPDGYTLVLGNWATHVLNGPMFALSYDLQKDFEPVSLVSSDPLIIVARKSLPATNLKELIVWLKANSDTATQGTTGAGGISTIGGLLFQKETQTHFTFVPYRSGLGAAMQEMIAGHIDFMIDTSANSLPQVRAGAIKAFAITSKQRLQSAPDVPTVEEEGLPGLYALNWQAVFVPKATPAEIISKVNTAVMAALADETVRKQLTKIGQNIFPEHEQTPQALRAFQNAEIEKWWPIVRAANLKAG